MYQLPQTLHKTKGNPFFSAGLKKTEGTSSLRLFSKLLNDLPIVRSLKMKSSNSIEIRCHIFDATRRFRQGEDKVILT